MAGLLNQDLNADQMARFKQIFQAGFTYLDEGDNFTALMEHAQQDPKGAVSLFISKLATQIIQKTGEQDLMVLMSAMLAVMSNVIDTLRETGVEISDDDILEIINQATQQTLGDNPEFAQAVQQDPETMMELQGAQNV